MAVGATSEISKLKQPRSQVIDLQGKRVLPGFDDAHVHFYSGGASLAGPQLRYAKSEQEFSATLAAFAQHTPEGQWTTGGNWDHENWTPARLPIRQLIDDATKVGPCL